MSNRQETATPRPPLADMMAWIDIQPSSDPVLTEQIRSDPNQLDQATLASLQLIYTAALRRAATFRHQHPARLAPWETEETPQSRVMKREVRGMLMTHDPGLETDAVRALKRALGNIPQVKHGDAKNRERKPADTLDPFELPLSSVGALLDIHPGTAYVAAKCRRTEMHKKKLPGPSPKESIVPWDFAKDLEESGYPRREGVNIQYERLPSDPHDTDPEKIAYAREQQRRFVKAHKLANLPGLNEAAQPIGVAQAYHISKARVRKLMGGGEHFIDDYCTKHGVDLQYMQRSDKDGYGEFMLLEDAAEIWETYQSIPVAERSDIPLVRVRRQANASKSVINLAMTDKEKAQQIALKRALRPAGRALNHVSGPFAKEILTRIKSNPLSPYRIPVSALPQRFTISYSGVMKRLDYLGLSDSKHNPIKLVGHTTPQRCVSWQDLCQLERMGDKAPSAIDIDYDHIHIESDDNDEEQLSKKRYATVVQAGVLHIRPEILGITDEAAARIAKVVASTDTASLLGWLEMPEAAQLIPHSLFDTDNTHASQIAQPAALHTDTFEAADETASSQKTPGEATAGVPMGKESPRRRAGIPTIAVPVHKLVKLPDSATDEQTEAAIQDAIAYVEHHGGRVETYPDATRATTPYVSDISAGLLRHRNPKNHPPQKLAKDYLNREEIAAKIGQQVNTIDAILHRQDWWRVERIPQIISKKPIIAGRPSDETSAAQATKGSRFRATAVLWSQPRNGDSDVLPHYHPDIVKFIAQAAVGASERAAEQQTEVAPTFPTEQTVISGLADEPQDMHGSLTISPEPHSQASELAASGVLSDREALIVALRCSGHSWPKIANAIDGGRNIPDSVIDPLREKLQIQAAVGKLTEGPLFTFAFSNVSSEL